MKRTVILSLLLLALLITSCSNKETVSSNEPVPGLGETFAAYTMEAQLTKWSISTLQAKVTELSKTATPSPTPKITNTPAAATAPVVLVTTSGSQSSIDKCYAASYVDDVTIPDNTVLEPAQKFTKVWRLKNVGTCTWEAGTTLEFSGASQMNGPASSAITYSVAPGESIDVSVNLEAPTIKGSYIGYWLLRSETGELFGIGNEGNGVFYVKIVVDELARPAGANIVFSFTENACLAAWTSQSGGIPCPGIQDFAKGSVQTTNNPVIEGDVKKQLPTIIMIPNDGADGFLTGVFPPFQINAGDRFKSTIGCLAASPSCDVDFELSYIADDGKTYLLGAWGHTMDAYRDEVDIDLSNLAGTTPRFVFTVRNNGSSVDDRAFWMWPNIWR